MDERDIADDYSALATAVDNMLSVYNTDARRNGEEQGLIDAIEEVEAVRHQQERNVQDCRVLTLRILVPASSPSSWYTDWLNEQLREAEGHATAPVIDWSYELHRLEVPASYQEGDFLPLLPNGVKEEELS